MTGAYVRVHRDERSLVLDERSHLTPKPEAELPGVLGLEDEPPVAISACEERGGGPLCVIEGNVTELRSPSGLLPCCPVCRRTLTHGRCRQDGPVRGEMELRARIVVDDGTGALTAQLSSEIVERLLGMTREEAIALARERLDPSAVELELRGRTLLRRVRLLGRAVPGEWGLTLFVDSVMPVLWEPTAQAARLLEPGRLAPPEGRP